MSNISDEQRRSAREAAAAQVADLRHDPETCDVCTSFAIDRWLEVADRFKDDLLDEAIRLKAALGYTPDWPVVLNSGYETVDSIRKVLALGAIPTGIRSYVRVGRTSWVDRSLLSTRGF